VITEEMVAFTRERFPNLETTTYFVPPLLFTKTTDTLHPKYNTPVQDKPAASDLGCDRAESDVKYCIRHIADVTSEPMFVLVNYVFDNYLLKGIRQTQQQAEKSFPWDLPVEVDTAEEKKTTSREYDTEPEDATQLDNTPQSKSRNARLRKSDFRRRFSKARDLFPTPENLEMRYRRGDFDMLIISPKHGFLVIETKAVGYTEVQDKTELQKRVSKALDQLGKSETVLRHLFSDLCETVAISKTLALPNVQRAMLSNMLDAVPETATDLCKCLEADNVEQALSRILCADDLASLPEEGKQLKSEPGDTTLNPVLEWWKNVTRRENPGETNQDTCASAEQFSTDVYEKIISRLVGQFSKVAVESRKDAPEARTVSDCIHLTVVDWGSLVSWTLYNQVIDALKADAAPKKQGGGGRRRQDSSNKKSETTLRKTASAEAPLAREDSTTAGPEKLIGSDERVELDTEGAIDEKKPSQLGSSASREEDGKAESVRIREETAVLSASDSPTSGSGLSSEISSAGGVPGFEKAGPTSGAQRIPVDASLPETGSSPATPTKTSVTDEANDPNTTGVITSTESDDATKRVHCQTVSKDTDSELFVQDLLTRYKGKSIRLVVDECPSKVSPQRLHEMLSGSHARLQEVKSSFQELLEEEKGRQVRTDGVVGLSDLPAEADQTGPANGCLGKIEHHLTGIKERLRVLQPPHKKPLVTQTQEWKFHVTEIQQTCLEIEELFEEIQKLTTNDQQTSGASVLEAAEGTMLVASGLLFNIETSLGSFVLSDLFLTIRTQYVDQDISVWSSGVLPGYQPEGFVQKRMTHCLRCPPKVQNVLEQTEVDFLVSAVRGESVPFGSADHPDYTYQSSSVMPNVFPLPTDGPDVKLFDHSGHVTKVKDINDCSACGEALADYIQTTLREGQDSGLRLEDIVISGSFDVNGIRCEFLQALTQRGVPMEYESDRLASPPPYPGKVFVAEALFRAWRRKSWRLSRMSLAFLRIVETTSSSGQTCRHGYEAWGDGIGVTC
ncbi:hypothetical protein BaRGS_00024351, partial [Batillaria attramentaria]